MKVPSFHVQNHLEEQDTRVKLFLNVNRTGFHGNHISPLSLESSSNNKNNTTKQKETLAKYIFFSSKTSREIDKLPSQSQAGN